MSDGPNLPGWHLRAFDYVGLGFLLLVAELLWQHPKVWYSWCGALVIGLLCLWLGETAPMRWKKLQEKWRSPKALTVALAENAQLKQQLESLNSSMELPKVASSRLKIIEAHYGVEGINNPDVTQYLLERLHGNSYAELVGADLFHGFDPLPGNPNKKLTVRYSFDSREAGIVRPEYEWLILPEDMFLRKLLDVSQREKKLNENQLNSDLSRARESYEQCKAEKKVIAEKLELFAPLQLEAVHLADELTEFLKELGTPPAPKYTADDIQKMPLAQSRKLIEENDGDYAEACEYHHGKGSMRLTEQGLYKQLVAHNLRMWPWYDKVQASYEERFAPKVQSMQRRFVIADIPADALSVAIGGPDGTKNIRAIASKLWELAYKIKEKELPDDKDPRIEKP